MRKGGTSLRVSPGDRRCGFCCLLLCCHCLLSLASFPLLPLQFCRMVHLIHVRACYQTDTKAMDEDDEEEEVADDGGFT